MNQEVQKSRVCLIRVLEAEDRDTEGKQTGENFLETLKDLSSTIKGPAGIKEKRQIPTYMLVICLNSKNKENSYIFQRGKKQIIYKETRIQLTLLFTLKHGAETSKF